MAKKKGLSRVILIFSVIIAVFTTVLLVLSVSLLTDMQELASLEDKEAADGIGLAALIIVELTVIAGLAVVAIAATVFFILGLTMGERYAKILGTCSFAYSALALILSIIAFIAIT